MTPNQGGAGREVTYILIQPQNQLLFYFITMPLQTVQNVKTARKVDKPHVQQEHGGWLRGAAGGERLQALTRARGKRRVAEQTSGAA